MSCFLCGYTPGGDRAAGVWRGGAVGSFGPRPFPGMQEKVLLS